MARFRNDLHSVDVCRVLKNSPYNVAACIPEIVCANREEVIDTEEVQQLINKTYGKHFIVNIHTHSETDFLQYEIHKLKARI